MGLSTLIVASGHAMAGLGTGLKVVLTKLLGGVIDNRLRAAKVSNARADLSKELIFPYSGHFHIVLSHLHPSAIRTDSILGGEKTYRNQSVALKGITDVLEGTRCPEIVVDLPLGKSGASALCIGSNYSHATAMDLFGKHDAPVTFERFVAGKRVRFPYTIRSLGLERGEASTWYWRQGEKYRPPKQAILSPNRGPFIVPKDSDGRLNKDYLLFTRLPLGLDGQELIVLAGVYGPSIRAIRTLLTAADPKDLERALGAHSRDRGMQAIFEVSDLVRDGEGDTVPGGIRLVRENGWEPRPIEVLQEPEGPVLWTPGEPLNRTYGKA